MYPSFPVRERERKSEREREKLHIAHNYLFKYGTITWVCLDSGNSRLPHCYQMHQSVQMRVQTPAFHWTGPSHSEETKPTWTQLLQSKQNNDVRRRFSFFNDQPRIKSVPVRLCPFKKKKCHIRWQWLKAGASQWGFYLLRLSLPYVCTLGMTLSDSFGSWSWAWSTLWSTVSVIQPSDNDSVWLVHQGQWVCWLYESDSAERCLSVVT